MNESDATSRLDLPLFEKNTYEQKTILENRIDILISELNAIKREFDLIKFRRREHLRERARERRRLMIFNESVLLTHHRQCIIFNQVDITKRYINLTIKYTSRLALPTDHNCIICCNNCINEQEKTMVVCFPCGKCNNPMHLDCFMEYASRKSTCPTCRKDVKTDLEPVINSISKKIINESTFSGQISSKIILDGIQNIIKNMINGSYINIPKFLNTPRFVCITSWEDMFMIIGCEYNDCMTKLFLPKKLINNAKLFINIIKENL